MRVPAGKDGPLECIDLFFCIAANAVSVFDDDHVSLRQTHNHPDKTPPSFGARVFAPLLNEGNHQQPNNKTNN